MVLFPHPYRTGIKAKSLIQGLPHFYKIGRLVILTVGSFKPFSSFNEKKNLHRIAEVGQGLWRRVQFPSSKECQRRALCPVVFWVSKAGDRQPLWATFSTVTLIVKKTFFLFIWNFLYFSLCPLPCLFTRYHLEECGFIFTPSHQVFIHINSHPKPQSCLFSKPNDPLIWMML